MAPDKVVTRDGNLYGYGRLTATVNKKRVDEFIRSKRAEEGEAPRRAHRSWTVGAFAWRTIDCPILCEGWRSQECSPIRVFAQGENSQYSSGPCDRRCCLYPLDLPMHFHGA